MAGKIPPPRPPCLASLFRRGGKAGNPFFPRLCQVKTKLRPRGALLCPRCSSQTQHQWCGAVWGQPGGPSPPSSPAGTEQLRGVRDAPDGAALCQPHQQPPFAQPPLPTPPKLRAAAYLSDSGAGPPGKRSPGLWGVCDVSLRLFPNHHIKLQRFSSPGLLYSPAG